MGLSEALSKKISTKGKEQREQISTLQQSIQTKLKTKLREMQE